MGKTRNLPIPYPLHGRNTMRQGLLDTLREAFGPDVSDGPLGQAFQRRITALDPGGNVIGTATLSLRRTPLHGGALSARVEEVAVHPAHRGRGVGRRLVRDLVDMARSMDCYKVTLACAEGMVGWYESCGFRRAEVEMRIDLRVGESVGETVGQGRQSQLDPGPGDPPTEERNE